MIILVDVDVDVDKPAWVLQVIDIKVRSPKPYFIPLYNTAISFHPVCPTPSDLSLVFRPPSLVAKYRLVVCRPGNLRT